MPESPPPPPDRRDRADRPVRPLVLGVETSCDDTACAVVDGEGRVLASVVSSQLEAHRPYGGVVPEIASREHLRNWRPVRAQALELAGIGLDEVDLVAATRGPGLVGSLLVGLSLGKALAWGLDRPFYGVHHLEGHLFSPFLAPPERGAPARSAVPAAREPSDFVGLVVSGGHTALYRVRGPSVETLAETRDDAMGECFDKVGKRLGLPFPGGPQVDRLAEAGRLERGAAPLAERGAGDTLRVGRTLRFRTGRCGDSLDFSYSGLKTQALVEIERLESEGLVPDPAELLRLASLEAETAVVEAAASSQADAVQLLAAFRDAAVRQIVDRLARLHRRSPFRHLAVSGGVAANRALRRALQSWGTTVDVEVHLVALVYSGDNAAMVAHAALRRHRLGDGGDPFTVDARSRLPVGTG